MVDYIAWEDATFTWENNPYTWDEVILVADLVKDISGGGGNFPTTYKQLDEKKKKKLITLIAKVQGNDFKIEAYKNEDIKVIASDIEIVAKEVLGVNIKINTD